MQTKNEQTACCKNMTHAAERHSVYSKERWRRILTTLGYFPSLPPSSYLPLPSSLSNRNTHTRIYTFCHRLLYSLTLFLSVSHIKAHTHTLQSLTQTAPADLSTQKKTFSHTLSFHLSPVLPRYCLRRSHLWQLRPGGPIVCLCHQQPTLPPSPPLSPSPPRYM